LARHLVGEVKETLGPEETEDILRRVAIRMAHEGPPPTPGQSFEERLDQVVNYLESRGFIFRWEKTDDGYMLSNVNCPYRQVAEEHAEVCAMDSVLIEEMTGVEPKHLTMHRDGAPTCQCLLEVPD
jgi:predicted ArsR family transcriptional regulator